MVSNPDHVTVVVNDLDAAKDFFSLLGFEEGLKKVISGDVMERFMGVPGIEADHVTLVLKGCSPHFDIQLLKYHHPDPVQNEHVRDLSTIGFNHLCFKVDDIRAEISRLQAAGVELRNEVMEFRGVKLVFLTGPEGITIELVERSD